MNFRIIILCQLVAAQVFAISLKETIQDDFGLLDEYNDSIIVNNEANVPMADSEE